MEVLLPAAPVLLAVDHLAETEALLLSAGQVPVSIVLLSVGLIFRFLPADQHHHLPDQVSQQAEPLQVLHRRENPVWRQPSLHESLIIHRNLFLSAGRLREGTRFVHQPIHLTPEWNPYRLLPPANRGPLLHRLTILKIRRVILWVVAEEAAVEAAASEVRPSAVPDPLAAVRLAEAEVLHSAAVIVAHLTEDTMVEWAIVLHLPAHLITEAGTITTITTPTRPVRWHLSFPPSLWFWSLWSLWE